MVRIYLLILLCAALPGCHPGERSAAMYSTVTTPFQKVPLVPSVIHWKENKQTGLSEEYDFFYLYNDSLICQFTCINERAHLGVKYLKIGGGTYKVIHDSIIAFGITPVTDGNLEPLTLPDTLRFRKNGREYVYYHGSEEYQEDKKFSNGDTLLLNKAIGDVIRMVTQQ